MVSTRPAIVDPDASGEAVLDYRGGSDGDHRGTTGVGMQTRIVLTGHSTSRRLCQWLIAPKETLRTSTNPKERDRPARSLPDTGAAFGWPCLHRPTKQAAILKQYLFRPVQVLSLPPVLKCRTRMVQILGDLPRLEDPLDFRREVGNLRQPSAIALSDRKSGNEALDHEAKGSLRIKLTDGFSGVAASSCPEITGRHCGVAWRGSADFSLLFL